MMNITKDTKIISLFLLCLCVAGILVPAASARDSFAPNWLKEGTYATYTTNRASAASIFDKSSPEYHGLNCWNATTYSVLKYWNATLTWRCTSINETTAKLQVTFNYIGDQLNHESLNNASLQLTGEAYVDLYTRAVYTPDGTLLGTTQLWLPANPTEGQDMVVWDIASEKATLPARVNSMKAQTPQGIQDVFMADGTATINGKPTNFGSMYDLDTGLNVGGFEWDPIMAAIGIRMGNLETFSDTNVTLGTNDTSFNWMVILQYAILPIAVVLLCMAVFIKRRKKTH